MAVLAGGLVQEVHIDRASARSYAGNVYLGKVTRFLPGIEAAFVDVGLPRPGFLNASRRPYRAQARPPADDTDSRDWAPDVQEGEEILVQATRDPISTKGVRLTRNLSIPGRYLVLSNGSRRIGISRNIQDQAERERLSQEVTHLREALELDFGFVVRTAAQGVAAESLRADMIELSGVWRDIGVQQRQVRCPGPVYEDKPLPFRLVRDLVKGSLARVLVDDPALWRELANYARDWLPDCSADILLYEESRPLFERYGVEQEIDLALKPRVELPSGGFLMIEQTEAMATIDVNTGRHVGQEAFASTVYQTNLEAARIIPRQLRLRNLGGLIVIDFIDMTSAEHRWDVLCALQEACADDRARPAIEGFSSFGLVQISRKRARDSLARQLAEPCPMCRGTGMTRTPESTCIDILRAVRHAAQNNCDARAGYMVCTSAPVVERLLDEDAGQLAALSGQLGREIRISLEPSCAPGEFDLAPLRER